MIVDSDSGARNSVVRGYQLGFEHSPLALPTKFLSISFVRQIRLPRKAGEANLPPELLATHLALSLSTIHYNSLQLSNA